MNIILVSLVMKETILDKLKLTIANSLPKTFL